MRWKEKTKMRTFKCERKMEKMWWKFILCANAYINSTRLFKRKRGRTRIEKKNTRNYKRNSHFSIQCFLLLFSNAFKSISRFFVHNRCVWVVCDSGVIVFVLHFQFSHFGILREVAHHVCCVHVAKKRMSNAYYCWHIPSHIHTHKMSCHTYAYKRF